MLKKSDRNIALNQVISKKFRKIQFISLISFSFSILISIATVGGKVSIESFINSASDTSLFSAILLVLMFGIKSLTVVIPLSSLYIASGILFSPFLAVTVSFLGLAVTLTIPYIIGRWSGKEGIDFIKLKYPKIRKLIKMQEANEFFASFIIRMVGLFPCDVVSFYFGACGTKYITYLLSAILGCAIGVVTNTLLGDVLLNPFSKQFIVLMIVKIFISVASFAIAYFLNRGKIR